MIIEAVIRAFFSVLKLLFRPIQLPALEPGVFDSIHEVLGYIGSNSFSLVWLMLPRGVVMTLFVIMLLVIVAHDVYLLVMWIIRKIPGGMD